MGIPEHVRRQAMDAVSNSAILAQIRSFKDSGIDMSLDQPFTYAETPAPERSPIPEHVRREAMSAVSDPMIREQIRLARDNGTIEAPFTPTRSGLCSAEKVAGLHRSGMDMAAVQQTITRDGFGREA